MAQVVQSNDRTVRCRTVAVVGNPNTGKSCLFNALTGFRQHVGNYPGVTVEKRTGMMRVNDGALPVRLIDLPGAYGLAARAIDEVILLDVLLGRVDSIPAPDLIVVVVDAANLSRNLFLTTQILELGRSVVVALNMMDVAGAAGVEIDVDALSREIGAAVVPLVAVKQKGIAELRHAIVASLEAPPSAHCAAFPDCVCAELDGLCANVNADGNGHSDRVSRVEMIQTLLDPGGYHEERLLRRCGAGLAKELARRRDRIQSAGESISDVEARVRYAWIRRVVDTTVKRSARRRVTRTERADRILTHRLLGMGVLIVVLALCFQAVFSWSAPLMNGIDAVFARIGDVAASLLPAGALQSLVVDGAVAGVGAVLVFLPQIIILFLVIAVLEDCGYMARAAFLLDRWLRIVGLNGRSLIPLVSSFACAVPGILATRTIENRRDRFVTMLIAPLMSCSARLPVYTLMIAAFIPANAAWGGLINRQALVLLAIYFLGVVVAVPVALLLKATILKGRTESFLMELPTYKWPSARNVAYRVYEQGREFCVSAGTIIFAVALVTWALGYYPHPESIAAAHEAQRDVAQRSYSATLDRVGEEYGPDLNATAIVRHEKIARVLARLEELGAGRDAGPLGSAIQTDDGSALANGTRSSGNLPSDVEPVDAVRRIIEDAGPDGNAAWKIRLADLELEHELTRINRSESGTYLRQSILGRVGRWIEPAVRPLGWDWRIGMAAIASFPAREVVIGTLGTIYNLGGDQDASAVGLRTRLRSATWPDGTPVFNVAVALSIMVFFALCCQCASTLAVIKRETRSWRWPFFAFTYMTVLAYVGAFVTFQVASRLVS